MPPSPPKSVARRSGFDAEAHQTSNAAAFFAPDSLPLPKIRRAWERQPVSPFHKDRNSKKIWKRQNTRSGLQALRKDAPPVESRSPKRITKKLRLSGGQPKNGATASPSKSTQPYKATRWDRRKSVSPRKRRIPRLPEEADDLAAEDAEESEDIETDVPSLCSTLFPSFEAPRPKDEHSDEEESFSETDSVNEITSEGMGEERPPQAPIDLDSSCEEGFDAKNESEKVQAESEPNNEDVHSYEDSAFQDDELSHEPVDTSLASDEATENMAPSHTPNTPEETMEPATPTPTTTPLAVDAVSEEAATTPGTEQDNLGVRDSEKTSLDAFGQEKDISGTADLFEPEHTIIPDAAEDATTTNMSSYEASELQEDEDSPLSDLSSVSPPQSPVTDFVDETVVLPPGGLQSKVHPTCHSPPPSSLAKTIPASSITAEDATVSLEGFGCIAKATGPAEVICRTEDLDVSMMDAEPSIVMKEYEQAFVQNDIAAGLTLRSSAEPELTVASELKVANAIVSSNENDLTLDFNEDTALLKDFLNRAAASKANKAATITDQESISHRRDSDAVRQALASPRKALEKKDPNISPSKLLSPPEKVPSPVKKAEPADEEDTAQVEPVVDTTKSATRRSSRNRQTRIPPPTTSVPERITLRMPNDITPVQKTERQELTALTKGNTRRNKGSAVPPAARLKYLKAQQMYKANSEEPNESTPEVLTGKQAGDLPTKGVKWDEQLVYTQDMVQRPQIRPLKGCLSTPKAPRLENEAEVTTTTADGELESKKRKAASTKGTPHGSKIRRLRGLNPSNSTPSKSLLANASFEPEEESSAPSKESFIPTSVQRTPTKAAKSLPHLQIQPSIMSVMSPDVRSKSDAAGVPDVVASLATAPTSDAAGAKKLVRKSRLAAPKKVVLPGFAAVGETASTSAVLGADRLAAARPVKRRSAK